VIDASLFAEPAERKLYDAMQAARVLFTLHFGAGDYTGALKSLAPLKAPVDAFFEGVMVNVEDSTLRANRLALLNELHVLMNKVADLSRLAT
jgi:glycyl-tRNA synthetase beta chain